MSTKFKILSAISFICLALVLTFVGVWALTDLDFVVGGNITYTAPEPELEGVNAEDVSYLTFEYDDTNNTAKLTACSSSSPNIIDIPEKVIYNQKSYTVKEILVEEVYNSIEDEYVYYSIFRNCTNTKSIIVPDTVDSIGEYIFTKCTGLTSVTIGSGVTSIGEYAFFSCTGLTSITIPDSVTSIGYQAFWGCTGLTSVTIGSGVTSIGAYAFQNCTGLTSITIPDSVTSIGTNLFNSCSGLTSIKVESGNAVYNSNNNCNAIIETATNTLIAGCKSTTIPNTVKTIGDYAFNYCAGLTTITIPDSVTSIGWFAFDSCTGLKSVTIGSGVTSIGYQAFSYCTNLATVNVKATSVPTGGSSMFSGCSTSLKIYVPSASVSNYQSATYWKDYSSKIVGTTF